MGCPVSKALALSTQLLGQAVGFPSRRRLAAWGGADDPWGDRGRVSVCATTLVRAEFCL